MSQKQKSGGGRKLGRMKIRCRQYASEFRRDKNRRRKMRRHIRDNPYDAGARLEFEKTYGPAKAQGLSARGRKVRRRAERCEWRNARTSPPDFREYGFHTGRLLDVVRADGTEHPSVIYHGWGIYGRDEWGDVTHWRPAVLNNAA